VLRVESAVKLQSTSPRCAIPPPLRDR